MTDSEIYAARQAAQDRRMDYRQKARGLVLSAFPGSNVDKLAHVHESADGAFVEAQIWIPADKIR